LKFGASDGALDDQFGYSIDIVKGGPGEGTYALVGSIEDIELSGSVYLFQNKFDTLGWQQKLKLTASDEIPGSGPLPWNFGESVSIASGSDGIYMLVGAPDTGSAGATERGAAYLFHSKSGETFYIDSAGPTNQRWQTKITSSDLDSGPGFGLDRFGTSVSVVSGPDSVYMLVGAPFVDPSDVGAAYLFHSKSGETFYVDSAGPTNQRWQTKITASDMIAGDENFGAAVSLASGPDELYMLVGAPEDDGGRGSAYLFHSKSGETFYIDSAAAVNQAWQTRITASDRFTSDNFGKVVSLISGTDELYMAVGLDGGSIIPRSYLFHSKSGEPFYIQGSPDNQKWQTQFTASDGLSGDSYGESISVSSGSAGIYVFVGAWTASGSFGEGAGKVYSYHSQSAGVGEQILTASDGALGEHFGRSVSSVVEFPDTLHTTIGAPDGGFFVSGSGAAYGFTGLFGFLSGTLGIQSVKQDYKQHGKLFGLGLGDVYDPAYAAYTPPMFYGASRARIKFTPSTTDTYTLDEVLGQATIEEIINVESNRVATVNGFAKSLTPLQDQNRMPVSSSINMFGKFFEPGVTYNPQTGQATSIDQISNINPAWVISTRFESPVLDMSSSKYNELYTAFAPDSDMATSYNLYPGSINRTNPRTMWASYGKTPPQTKRVTMELAESFPSIRKLKELRWSWQSHSPALLEMKQPDL